MKVVVMKLLRIICRVIAFISMGYGIVVADTIILRDGTVAHGNFIGGSGNTILFHHQGQIKEIPLSAIATLSLSPRHSVDIASGKLFPPP